MVSAPRGVRPIRWGMGDAVAGWLLSQVGGAVTFSLAMALSGTGSRDPDELSLGWVAAGQLGLWLGFLGVPWLASRTKGNGIVRDFGLRGERRDVVVGSVVGVLSQLVLLPLLYLPLLQLLDRDAGDVEQVARNLTDRATDPIGVVLLVLIVGLGAPVAEEVFYRGLVFRSLEKRFGTWPGIVVSGVVFGASHLEWLTLPGLALFGGILAYLTHRTQRLAPAVAAHVAFNMVTVVVLVTS